MSDRQRGTPRADILIVDDTPANLRLLAGILAEQGHKVRPASHGQMALLAAQAQPPDLILLDIMMPEMDGYETMQRIRKLPKFGKLPMIALTAKAMKGDREKCLEAGANDYLPKPVDVDRLISMLRVWLYQ